GNPLHLHPNYSSCASIVSVKLTSVENYRIWTSALKLALHIEHKMGLIIGACSRSDYLASASLLDQWDRCNDEVDDLLNDKSTAGPTNMAGWIIDSGANQHMTNDTKNMFNLIGVSGLNLAVGHLNRTIAKITHVGNLKLNNDVILFDGLVVLEYTVSLLSVNKLIKDSKLSVCFDESNCYIQDLRKGKILETGSEFAGLYLFDEKFNVSHTVCNSFLPHISLFLVYGREPNLSHLRSFGCLCYAVVVKGSDKFSIKSENWICKCREGSLHQPVFDNNNESGSDENAYHPGNDVVIYQPRHGEPQTATPIDEIYQSEGNVGSSNE
nr:ribonuclease H-like domain-containing protein [Tanacetum cinerariifolium]